MQLNYCFVNYVQLCTTTTVAKQEIGFVVVALLDYMSMCTYGVQYLSIYHVFCRNFSSLCLYRSSDITVIVLIKFYDKLFYSISTYIDGLSCC